MNAAPASAAAIGTSMLEFMADDNDSSQDDATSDAPSVCLLHALLGKHFKKKNIVVSGHNILATSLAMDLAHSAASRHEPVLFLTCASKTSIFPLFCSPKQEEIEDEAYENNKDWQAKLRRIEEDCSFWNQRALKRIKVVHCRSWRDLMLHLLKLDPIQNPGVIIVDGIDDFVKQDSPTMTPEMATEMMHVFAVAADTARALNVPVVATTHTTLAPHVERLIGSWFPNVVRIQQNPVHNGATHGVKNGSIESSWIVQQQQSGEGNNSHIELCINKRILDGRRVILWALHPRNG